LVGGGKADRPAAASREAARYDRLRVCEPQDIGEGVAVVHSRTFTQVLRTFKHGTFGGAAYISAIATWSTTRKAPPADPDRLRLRAGVARRGGHPRHRLER